MVKIISIISILVYIIGFIVGNEVKYTIPLGYYSNRNLPFGISSDVHIDQILTFNKPQPYNLTINPNSPFTILFGFKDIDPVQETNIVKFEFLGNLIEIKGLWVSLNMEIPIIITNHTSKQTTHENMPLKIRAFCTSERSFHNDMNFLGLSPGPKNLIDYSFYHQFKKVYNTDIKNIKLSVIDHPELYYNWIFESKLEINTKLTDKEKNSFIPVTAGEVTISD